MKLIKADPNRRVEIAGLPVAPRRPVDIDKSHTGFARLRSLRIYRFDVDSVIDGEAEEDEVLIVVMAGSIELTMSGGHSADSSAPSHADRRKRLTGRAVCRLSAAWCGLPAHRSKRRGSSICAGDSRRRPAPQCLSLPGPEG